MFYVASEAFWLRGWQDNTYGPQRPIAMANDAAVGTIAWGNLGNAADLDGLFTTATLASGETSNYLKVTDYDFVIPASALITGIRVDITRNATVTSVSDTEIKLIKGGTIQSTNRGFTANLWEFGNTTVSYGGYGDLWGTTWNPSDISASNFGVALSALSTGSTSTANVDSIKILVWYYV